MEGALEAIYILNKTRIEACSQESTRNGHTALRPVLKDLMMKPMFDYPQGKKECIISVDSNFKRVQRGMFQFSIGKRQLPNPKGIGLEL